MTLVELIEASDAQISVLERQGDLRVAITDVTDDSRQVKPGSLFVAVKGERVDGHEYVQAAVKSGASAVVMQSALSPGVTPMIRVAD